MNYNNMYDMIIVGGGPSGLSAAIYMARAKYKVLVLEKEKFGGQITITSEIVNYPGVKKTSGKELTSDMQKQAEMFGAEFKISEVLDFSTEDGIKTVKTSTGEYKALSIVLALGASPRKTGFSGEEEFTGRGVAYCATCDGEFFTGKPVYVVGGGFAAVEESIFLTKYASSVDILVRKDEFTCAKTVSDHLDHEDKINVHFNSEIETITGDDYLKNIKYKNNLTNEVTEKTHDNGFGVFVFAGYEPNTNWLSEKVELDNGYIVTTSSMETNVKGIYASGDVCIKNLRQVVTAVSDGAIAATSAEKYVEALHKSLNIPSFEVEVKEVKEVKETPTVKETADSDNFLSDDIKAQLMPVFEKFSNTVQLKAVVDNSDLASEMKSLINEFDGLTNKIVCKVENSNGSELAPYLEISKEDDSDNSIKFYAMPGGHEFNSFIISLYNMAGPGKEIAEDEQKLIESIDKPIDIKVLISLSCTMCPDVVMAAAKLASVNPLVKTSIIDISKFTDIKDKYKVMSVPCMVVDDEKTYFGKKNISQIIDILNSEV